MRRIGSVAVLGVLLLVAACGSSGTPPGHDSADDPASTATPSPTTASSSGAATSILRVSISAEQAPRPREGYRPWLRLSRGGHSWRPRDIGEHAALFEAPPGRYTLRAGVRLCNTNCQMLEPPTATCHGRVTVPARGVAVTRAPAVTLRVTGHCAIGTLY